MEKNRFPFNVLFWFETDSHIITEVKRTDLQSEDKSLVYKWLVIEKKRANENGNTGLFSEFRPVNGGIIWQLTFQSMEQAEGTQIRNFAEGKLSWNSDEAVFNDVKMVPVKPQDVSTKWMQVIDGFLR